MNNTKRLHLITFASLMLSLLIPACTLQAGKVELTEKDNQWTLIVDGKPFEIKGAGGDGSKELLKKMGGNSFRTWGVDAETKALLDKADKLGLKVAVGFWVGHERHGFDYGNVEQVASQYEKFAQVVKTYKDHPAVLCWVIGNEMEAGVEKPAAIYSAINNMAALAKKLDPDHPTMTVIAELGENGRNIKAIHRLCPDIDIIGINTYGGGPSVAKRYHETGGKKPFVITEFGTLGQWESGKTDFGSAIEMTSTDKAQWYKKTYQAAHADPFCLGSYAFAWGHKMEATATWHGMLLPDGSRLAAVDTVSALWTGKQLDNQCPAILKLEATTPVTVKPGGKVEVSLELKDPDKDALKVTWLLKKDDQNYITGGDAQDDPTIVKDGILKASKDGATIQLPEGGGAYRVYMYARDGQGGAAVGNIPLYVDAPEKIPAAALAKTPFTIYAEVDKTGPFAPSGWMGAADAITMIQNWKTNPHSGKTCIKIHYAKGNDWGGVVWQHPEGDWGDRAGGFNLSKANQISFYARGEDGGEKVQFSMGILGRDKKFYDTAKAESTITLTKEWKQYTIDLSDRDLSRIKTGFVWVVAGQGKPLTFYLDDIQYTKADKDK